MHADIQFTDRHGNFKAPRGKVSAKVILLNYGMIALERKLATDDQKPKGIGAYGGKFEPSRAEGSTREVAVNEVREETGIVLNPDDLIGLHITSELLFDKKENRHIRRTVAYFAASVDQPITKNSEGTPEHYDSVACILEKGEAGVNLCRALRIAAQRGIVPMVR